MRVCLSWRPPLALILAAACAACGAPPSQPRQPVPRPENDPVPALGTASSLDMATWNIEWFGDPANGPAPESLQVANVRDVIAGTDADIWSVQAVVDSARFASREGSLTGYAAFLANESHVVDGPGFYSGFSNREQKVGFIYKSAVATLLGAKLILTANDFDFAGRPPLEARFRVTLNGATEEIVVIALHMKCCIDTQSHTRRQNAAAVLKAYLDATHPAGKVFVLGDWNDDLDASITPGSPSPYTMFLNAAEYAFPTRALTEAGLSSTTRFGDVIDHHLVTDDAFATYVAGSATAYKVDAYIRNFASSTTDHYPVVTRYRFGTP